MIFYTMDDEKKNSAFVYAADITPLKAEKNYNSAFLSMPEDRRARTDRLKQPEDRTRSVGAYLLLQQAYKAYTKVDDDLPQILIGDNGKPYFDACNIHFNLSHAGDLVLCALSYRPVGCDVERKSKNFEGIAKRFFAPEEYDWIMQETDSGQAFIKIWTLKESLLKATGLGIGYPMDSFSVVAGGRLSDTITFGADNSEYHAVNFQSSISGYEFSCCALSLINPQLMWINLQ